MKLDKLESTTEQNFKNKMEKHSSAKVESTNNGDLDYGRLVIDKSSSNKSVPNKK